MCFYYHKDNSFTSFQPPKWNPDRENTKTENASFPYKTAKSEANVNTNRIVSTKLTYHKERSFASNDFIFLKVLFQFNNLL